MKKLSVNARKFATAAILAIGASLVTEYFLVLVTSPDMRLMPGYVSGGLQAACTLVAAGFWFVCLYEAQKAWKSGHAAAIGVYADMPR